MNVLSLAALLLAPQTVDVDRVYSAFQSKIAGLKSASGAVINDARGRKNRYEFAIKRPGMFFVYGENQAFFCNGKKVWQYMPKTKEFNEPPFEHYGSGPLLDPFRAFFVGAEKVSKPTELKMAEFDGKQLLHAISRPNGQITLTGVIDPQTLLPVAHIQKIGDQEIVSEFLEIRENVELEDDRFTLPTDAKPFEKVDYDAKLLPVGKPAPNFELQTPDGKTVDLKKEIKGGKILWLNFWFYGCGPCQAELPTLNATFQKLKSKGLRVLTVNQGDDAKLISQFLKEKSYGFPVGMNQKGGPDVAKMYGVQAYPTNYLIAPDGRVLARFTSFDEKRVMDEIRKAGIDF